MDEAEGVVILTCHHVVAQVARGNLRVRLPLDDGTLGNPVRAIYDEQRSRPERDAAVLRLEYTQGETTERTNPLLHRLEPENYDGALSATVLTYRMPDNFDATVWASTYLEVEADQNDDWPETPECYRMRAFRLANPTDSEAGISGGVVVCEEGVLGLAHFGREQDTTYAREAYAVPLSAWAEEWPALQNMIMPLVDSRLKAAASVKRGADLSVGLAEDVIVAGYRPDVYAAREIDDMAQRALDEHEGVFIVGRPLSGKSRLVVELLREYPRSLVVIPRSYSPARPKALRFPAS